MPDIATIIQSGAANPWLYFPAAMLLGALHALEPGHSKSMMAAFIVAVRGTPGQAALLGGAAAVGHTFIVWLLAALGLFLGDQLVLDKAEPWLTLIVGLLTIGLAIRIFFMARGPQANERHHDDHDHHHQHGHDHDHGHHRRHADTHGAAHEQDVAERFAGRRVTNLDIIWFGLTGGLLPCPSAVAVLLICIQLKAFTLGFAMVAAFSIGLAAALIAVGVVAAWGTQKMAGWQGFSRWSEKLPYASAGIVLIVGVFICGRGLMQLA